MGRKNATVARQENNRPDVMQLLLPRITRSTAAAVPTTDELAAERHATWQDQEGKRGSCPAFFVGSDPFLHALSASYAFVAASDMR
jgi:hypothetical protein